MLPTERRVVITGLGIVSPLGIGPEATWAALSTRKGAIGPIRAFAVAGLPTDVGGEVAGYDARTLAIPKHKKALAKSLRLMARDIQLAVGAAERAVIDAGLADGGVDPTRIGVDLGAGLISTELEDLAPAVTLASTEPERFDYGVYGQEGIPLIPPLWLLKYLPNMPACHVSILNDCQGPSNTITEAESASNLAITEATRIIARGQADVMISGGADSKIHPLSLIRMSLLDQMSRESDPSRACRPFDRGRDGWVPGEGAGILILEEREHALARGARIYGEILGCGSGCDAYPGGGLDPDGAGTEIALKAALRDAGLSPGELGHVNAHGAATVVSDLAEARAFGRLFGGPVVPVNAYKGYIGNTVSGSGAIELIFSLLAASRGLILPTLHCDDPDPACALDLVVGEARSTANRTFLKTSLTRHGQASAVVVRAEPATA